MTKKKTEQDPQASPPPAKFKPFINPRDVKVKVFVEESFVDGNLREFFEQLGYSVEWPAGVVREIPNWLIERCVQSGAVVTRVDD